MSSKSDQLEQNKQAEIIKKIPQELLLIKKLIKFSKHKLEQQRVIAISKTSVYNIEKVKLKRTLNILTVQAISISSKSNQFTLHVPSEYDVRYISSSRDQIIFTILKNRSLLGDPTRIPLFIVQNSSLDHVTTTEDDIKKNKRKTVQAQHQLVNQITFGLYIYKQFNIHKDAKILFVSEEHLSNCSPRQYKKLMKIGKSSICNTQILKCFKTNELIVSKYFDKKHLKLNIDQFRNLCINYKQIKYTEKLLLAKQKENQFQFFFQFYTGDMYGQLKTQCIISEILLIHTCVRMVLAMKDMDFIIKTISPQNILIDNHGNPVLSLICSYLNISSPNQYLSPEEIQFLIYQTPIKYPKMTNLWKLGIATYELAYGVPPFPLAQIISAVTNKRQFILHFPAVNKSKQLQYFLQSILKLDPENRVSFPNFNNILLNKWFKSVDIRRYQDTPVHLHKYLSKIQIQQNYSQPIQYYHVFNK